MLKSGFAVVTSENKKPDASTKPTINATKDEIIDYVKAIGYFVRLDSATPPPFQTDEDTEKHDKEIKPYEYRRAWLEQADEI